MNSSAPLAKLYISESNVRKTDRDLDIGPLADNIAAHGLIEPLVTVDEGKGKGRLGIIAGGRRFLALQLLAERGDWPADKLDRDAIPVQVRATEEAREISLSENIHSVAMNPADEFEAFAGIIADYEAHGEADPAARIARCARHFGKTERYVEQRLRLAALAPDILDALRTGRISLDAARAYAMVADHKVQLEVYAAQERQSGIGERGHRVAGIRTALSGRIYRVADRQVRYVGLDAYVAAGGRVDRDLFMGSEDDEVVLDTELLDRLATAKAEPEAASLAREAGFAGAVLKSWGPASFLWPPNPEGTARVYALTALAAEDRARALVICAIAAEGSRLELTPEGFLAAKAAAPPSASDTAMADGLKAIERARPGQPHTLTLRTGESEIERLARIRRGKIEAAAIRLAVPAFAGTPFEGRAFFPPEDMSWIEPVQESEDSYAVAVYVTVPKADVSRHVAQAQALVDGEPGAAGTGSGPPWPPKGEGDEWPDDRTSGHPEDAPAREAEEPVA